MTNVAPHHIALLCQVPKAGDHGPFKRVSADDIDVAEWLCKVGLLTPMPNGDRCYRRTPLGDRMVRECLFVVDTTLCAIAAARDCSGIVVK